MKYLFFVSVAFSVFSGTSLSATAQKINNAVGFTDGISNTASPRFIDGIEISSETRQYAVPVADELKKQVAITTVVENAEVSNAGRGIEFASTLQFKYGQILNRNVEFIKNISLFSFIEDWWGTRYRYGGTGRKGIDCSALTGLLMGTVFGVKLPRTAREQYKQSEKIDREDMQEGDLVFFNTHGGVSHVGVYLGDDYFVHASSNSGVIISSLSDSYYEQRFIGGGRVIPQMVSLN